MRLRKFLIVLVALVLLIGMTPISVFATNDTTESRGFSDMPNNWSTEALQHAVDNGLMNGSDGKLNPKGNLTRAEMATIIARAFNAYVEADLSAYSDVGANQWYAKYIARAHQMQIMEGSKGLMKPQAQITRQETFVIIARALKLTPAESLNKTFSDAGKIANWAKGELAALVNAGYIQGAGGKLNPTGNITRAEFAQVMKNVIEHYITEAGTVTGDFTGNVMVNVAGVTLKGSTINGDLIIGEGVGEGDVTLDNVTVTGRVLVRGGGVASIHIIGGSDIQSLIILRVDGKVRVVTEDGIEVKVVVIEDGSDDVFLEGTFGTVTVVGKNIKVDATKATITNGVITGANSEIISGPPTGGGGTPPPVVVPVSAITVTGAEGATTITTDKGTLQMKAEVGPSNASNKEITWSVDNESIATINANSGLLTAVANGTVTVKATAKDGSGVVGEKLITISGQLLPSTIVFADGATVSKVYGEPAFTNTVSGDGAGAVTYSSGTPATATINETTGEVTIVGVGTTEITATKAATETHATVTKTYTLTVTAKALTVSGLSAKYNPGATAGTGTVTIEGTPALVGIVGSDDVTITGTATGSIAGSSSSETVTIIGLSLTGAKAGNYTLSLPTDLTVDATTVLPASEFSFADESVAKVYGDTPFTNTVTNGAGAGPITYSSGTPATATINETTGEVTIVGVGTTVITAVKAATETHATVTKTYTLTVTAKPLEGITLISGTAKVGETLTAGSVTPSEATFNYQWLICDTADGIYANIDGATNSTYKILAEDAGKYIKVVATGTGNYGGSVTSEATVKIENAEQAVPASLAGVTPTSVANNDGKITGTTAEMEYKLQSEADTEYKDCSAETTVVGAAGTYVVRVKAKTGYNASPETVVTVNAYIASTDASLSDLTVDGSTITSFSVSTITYNVELAAGTTTVPTVGATVNNSKATIAITQASTVTDSATIVVTAEDGTTTKTYKINFTVAADTTAPVITASDETVAIANLATWTKTVSATDDVDGDVTAYVVATYFKSDGTTSLTDLAAAKEYIGDASVNTSFIIKYNVSDAAGNPATEVVVTITVTKANIPDSISVGGKTLNSTTPYLVDGTPATTGTLGVGKCTAHFDPITGVLSLQDYVGGVIRIDEAGKDLRIKLIGNDNKITGGQFGIHNDKGDIHVTSDSVALLEIDQTSPGAGAAIVTGWQGFGTGSVFIGGKVKLTIKAEYTGDKANDIITGIYAGKGSVTIQGQADYSATLTNPNYQGRGILSEGKTIINTSGNIEIDVSNSVRGVGIQGYGGIEIKQVNSMLITIPSTGESTTIKFTNKEPDLSSGVAVNKSTTVASYRSGTPYTLGLEGGNITSATGGVIGSPHQYLEDDVITIQSTATDFDRWTKADGTALEESLFITGTENSATATIKMPAGSLSIKAKEKDKVIDIAAIQGVTPPVTGATPVTTITPTEQYTGTVTWSGTPTTFAGGTVYTATITLTPKDGFTLTGVTAGSFTVAEATTVNNTANSGVITAVFPATEVVADPNIAKVAADKALIQGGSYVIPLANQDTQEAKTAWVQDAVDALIENGTTAVVTFADDAYSVALTLGTVTDSATITVTEQKALNIYINGTNPENLYNLEGVLPKGLSWEGTTNTLTMNNFSGYYIKKDNLENITINLEGTNSLNGNTTKCLEFSNITINGTGTLNLQTDYIWGAQGKMTIMESATVDIKMTKPNGSNPIRAVFGDVTVKDSGLFKVDITMPDTNPQTRTMNAASNLTLEGLNAKAEIVLNGKKPSSASRIAQNIPHIFGKSKGYDDKNAGYKVTANWYGSDGTVTNPINLIYNIPSSVTDLYDKQAGLVNEDDVYISVDHSYYTLEMYENNFNTESKKDKISFAVGEDSKDIYIKTTKGADVKYYKMTVEKDSVAAAEALGKIQGYATSSNAAGLTIAHLKTAGVKEALEGNLAAYKTAIAEATSIADLAALQTLITNANVNVTATNSIANAKPKNINVVLNVVVTGLLKDNFAVTKAGSAYTDFTVTETDGSNYILVMTDAAVNGDEFTVTITKTGYGFTGTAVTNNVE